MKRILYFYTASFSGNEEIDICNDETYREFLDYAFEISNFFMLLYRNWYNRGYSEIQKSYMKDLGPFKVKSKIESYPENASVYQYIFYKNNEKAKEILKKINLINYFNKPTFPENLSFFKENRCRIKTITHEGEGVVLDATDKDVDFFFKLGLSKSDDIQYDETGFYDYCDEELTEDEGHSN